MFAPRDDSVRLPPLRTIVLFWFHGPISYLGTHSSRAHWPAFDIGNGTEKTCSIPNEKSFACDYITAKALYSTTSSVISIRQAMQESTFHLECCTSSQSHSNIESRPMNMGEMCPQITHWTVRRKRTIVLRGRLTESTRGTNISKSNQLLLFRLYGMFAEQIF
ncbi:hypothetical protein CEXT_792101 [Caerostris extrusa]|uniref:Uncharacterized protein n=1 Tax=Caerostris extrusa TaxID=172846 RepID=A0AAV4TB85_CAEEX|nr:hypothetical protein CEXT_792101 [Caerostris extrusa]